MAISAAKTRRSTSTMLSDVPVVQLKMARKRSSSESAACAERHGVGGALGRNHHLRHRRQRRQVVDVDGVGALAARAARVVGRRQVDLRPARREERHDRAVAAVHHAEEAALVEVDQRRALQDQVGHPDPVRVRRQRQLSRPARSSPPAGRRGPPRRAGRRRQEREQRGGLQRASPGRVVGLPNPRRASARSPSSGGAPCRQAGGLRGRPTTGHRVDSAVTPRDVARSGGTYPLLLALRRDRRDAEQLVDAAVDAGDALDLALGREALVEALGAEVGLELLQPAQLVRPAVRAVVAPCRRRGGGRRRRAPAPSGSRRG